VDFEDNEVYKNVPKKRIDKDEKQEGDAYPDPR